MALLKDNESEQLRQLVKACLLEISKLKIEVKKCQKESSRFRNKENLQIKEFKIKEQKRIVEKEKEINKLKVLLDKRELELSELRKIKFRFDALTAKPKKDLTSFQSQIYQLLPYEEDNVDNLYIYIKDVGFSELSRENFEHVLKNLGRKGYLQSFNHFDEILWKKLDKSD
jgi:hypothetical protein